MSSSGEPSPPVRRASTQSATAAGVAGPSAKSTVAAAEAGGSNSKKKKRIRNWTADDRAVHRVFERSRREAFKERLQTLASLVPSLQSVDPNRLSKHVVVDESITFIRAERQEAAHSLRTVDALLAERDGLLVELNRWRATAGLDVRLPRDLPVDDLAVAAAQSPAIPQGSMRPVAALRVDDWVAGGGNDLLPAGDEPALLEEPEPFGAPELELENSLGLMQLPVGSASSAGHMGGASWSPSAPDFAMPGLQTDFGDLFSTTTKGLPQQSMVQTYGLPLTDMELAQDGSCDRVGNLDIADPRAFGGDHAHIYSGSI
ncbi:hypothetical protein JDV02_002172 [Purpureocillium takamizusanense]|uniref:BHLH domain-containing protein n=1 Tax=Purpureocillium takamizusanense TaxID=2060973 RepID=A0A9Q8QB13_9HYPO|nr:uncharacterized protein JDV02_002172 [Purpureocillium takamizusanense]UNI15661.1 hypothetical protein JDV02_002172 [Purpureocillium takamizusanense]